MIQKNKSVCPARTLILASIVLASCLVFVHCGGKKPSGPPPAWLSDAPRSDDQYLYGSGCAQHQISNHIFKRRTAHERARVELARTVHEHVTKEFEADPQAVRRVVESVLPDRETTDTYMDEEGNFCALAGLLRKRVGEAVMEEKTSAGR